MRNDLPEKKRTNYNSDFTSAVLKENCVFWQRFCSFL